MIIRDNLKLPKLALQVIATLGWLGLLYLVWVILGDSWERSYFAIGALAGQIPAEINPFIDRYTARPIQTLFHTGAGLIFATLGPLQFMSPVRERWRSVHRWSGRIFLPFGIASGVAALVMTMSFPIWGHPINKWIGVGFSVYMLYAFIKAFGHIRKREIPAHRRWMIRGFSVGMGVAVFRVMLNDWLQPAGYEFNEAWNLSMWLCFPTIILVAEFWIWATSKKD